MQVINNPRISIIVPCYNGEKYLRETLDCLQKQTIEDWECVIVNDGSIDGSLEIMKEYAKKDSRYKYIDKENGGPSIARNTAIKASCGKYILPLDADDIIAPSYAEKAMDYLDMHDKCKVVYCKAEFFGEKNQPWEISEYNYEDFKWGNVIFCSAIYRKSDYEKTVGYNKNMQAMFEDWDFWLSLLGPDDEVYKIPETLFFYRQHSDSRTQNTFERISRARLQIMLNHPLRYQLITEKEVQFIDIQSHFYKEEFNNILSSRSYRIGKVISSIAKFVLNPFKL